MEKSMVADNDSGESLMSLVRTSSGAFLAKHEVITLHRGILLARSRAECVRSNSLLIAIAMCTCIGTVETK